MGKIKISQNQRGEAERIYTGGSMGKDFSKLTKEQKIELFEAIQEKKRRIKAKRPLFKPNKGQLKVIHSDAQEKFAFCGNGWGKSTLLVNEVEWTAKGYNPITKKHSKVPAKIIVVLDSPEKLEQKYIPEHRKWFSFEWNDKKNTPKDGKPYISRMLYPNGSVVHFMFFNQDDLKFEGIDGIDFIATDEPFPRYIYVGLYRGTREKGSNPKLLLVGTPISQAWLRQEVYEPWKKGERPGTECFKFSLEDNRENLREGYIEEFASKLTEAEKKTRLEGAFFDADSMPLAGIFKRDVHVIPKFDWPAHYSVVIAIDPHPSKKHHAVMVGSDQNGQLYYIKEISSGAAPEAFARELRLWYDDYKVIDIVCDSLGSGATTGGDGNLSFIQVLNRNGVRTRATTFKEKSDEDFMERIKTVLEIPQQPATGAPILPKLLILNGNYGVTSDIENCQWQKRRHSEEYLPKLEISDKDWLACLKYALATGIMYNNGRKAKVIKPKTTSPWGKLKKN